MLAPRQETLSDKTQHRQYPRMNVRHVVTVRASGFEINLTTASLSFGGAFLTGNVAFPVGTIVEILITENESTVTTQARVVHSHDNGFGIAFIEPPDAFTDQLYQIVYGHVVQNVKQGHGEDTVPGRMALLYRREVLGYRVLFTSHLSPKGVWVMTENPEAFPDTFWITLPDRGLFDVQVKVEWRYDRVMGLQFVDPSEDFSRAYQTVINSFLGH